jgi:hypothetical protein
VESVWINISIFDYSYIASIGFFFRLHTLLSGLAQLLRDALKKSLDHFQKILKQSEKSIARWASTRRFVRRA